MEEVFPRAKVCGQCHVAIYSEWSDSAHANAYTQEEFREATDGYRFGTCLGCHAPKPMLTDSAPPPRQIFREEGVTCVSCHLEEGKLTGPIRPSGVVVPHPVAVSDSPSRSSRLCGRCHEATFAEWQTAAGQDKPTCQYCHMPPIARKITQATSWFSKMIVATEETVPQRLHTFSALPSAGDEATLTVSVNRRGDRVCLTLRNRIPHSLPTGEFGVRIVVLEIFAVNGSDGVLPVAKYELIKELGTAVAPRGSKCWTFEVPSNTAALRVRLLLHGRDPTEVAELFSSEFVLQ